MEAVKRWLKGWCNWYNCKRRWFGFKNSDYEVVNKSLDDIASSLNFSQITMNFISQKCVRLEFWGLFEQLHRKISFEKFLMKGKRSVCLGQDFLEIDVFVMEGEEYKRRLSVTFWPIHRSIGHEYPQTN